MKQIMIAFALFIFAGLCIAGPESILAPVEQNAQLIKELQEQNIRLNAEVAVLKSFHSTLIDTIYFVIGTVIVIFVALIGYSWFNNEKVLKKELDNLVNDLSNRQTKFEIDLLAGFKNFKSEFNAMANKSMDDKLLKESEILSRKITRDIDEMTYAFHEHLYEYYLEKVDYLDALGSAIKLLELATKYSIEWRIDDCLGDLIDILKKVQNNPKDYWRFIHTSRVTKISELLGKIDKKFDPISQEIRTLMDQIEKK